MKRFITAAAFLVLAASAHADGVAPQLKARYESMFKVIQAVDKSGYHTFLAENYTSVDPKGKVSSRAEYLKGIDPLFDSSKSIKMEIKFLKFTVKGDTVAQEFDVQGVFKSKDGKTSKMHEVGTDTWKKVGGKWMEIKTVDKVFAVK